jgi:hypothetical protein
MSAANASRPRKRIVDPQALTALRRYRAPGTYQDQALVPLKHESLMSE